MEYECSSFLYQWTHFKKVKEADISNEAAKTELEEFKK